MLLPLLSVTASASATGINVTKVNSYEDSSDVESPTATFGWSTASANSRMTVMTTRLRSAGEAGTSKSYGDFTHLGYCGKSYKTWNDVLSASDKFGMLYYTGKQNIVSGKTNSITPEI